MQVVILAAGESSRFWPLNKKHKSLIKIMGKPLIFYTLKALERIGILKVIIIQGVKKDIEKELKQYKTKIKIKYLVQPRAKGMGNALWQARNLLKDRFLVLNPERVDIEEIVKDTKYKIQDFAFWAENKDPRAVWNNENKG